MLSPVSPFSSLHVRLLIYSVHSHCQGIIENVDKPLNLKTRISCETQIYRPTASTIILGIIFLSHLILLNLIQILIQIFFYPYVIIGYFNLMDYLKLKYLRPVFTAHVSVVQGVKATSHMSR